MESREIIASIHQIFDRFTIIPNMREHMFRAGAATAYICDHWKGPPLNKDNMVATSLIHDLGNLAKMDFVNPKPIAMYGDEPLDYWKKVQADTIQKYGSADDHVVTRKMIHELGVNARVTFLIENKEFINNDFVLASDDWELKICTYADQRIGPYGVMSLEDRFKEVKERYAHRKNTSMTHPKVDLFIACSFKIEAQIAPLLDVPVSAITDAAIQPYIEMYRGSK
ncbi:MAG: hypothetical protein Q8P05_01860 [Candidatus Diapherotrites archaeon]|nr:hypothetical protein [Candidatus Diapherotrites archaeon]MDZ4256438.1 hypothetical protein [archaeon]